MTVSVEIIDHVGIQEHHELLKRAAAATVTHESIDGATELSLLLTDDNELQRLNHQFRDIDKSTDVLSFPSGESLPDSDGIYLGDIAISLQRATQQAFEGNHSLEAELQLLTVHGTLHLLGHDHADAAEKAAMWQAQASILSTIGAAITAPANDL